MRRAFAPRPRLIGTGGPVLDGGGPPGRLAPAQSYGSSTQITARPNNSSPLATVLRLPVVFFFFFLPSLRVHKSAPLELHVPSRTSTVLHTLILKLLNCSQASRSDHGAQQRSGHLLVLLFQRHPNTAVGQLDGHCLLLSNLRQKLPFPPPRALHALRRAALGR